MNDKIYDVIENILIGLAAGCLTAAVAGEFLGSKNFLFQSMIPLSIISVAVAGGMFFLKRQSTEA